MKKLVIGMLITVSCWAGTQTGSVTEILVRDSDGLIYFFMTNSATNRPDCAKNTAYWMIHDENSNVGKQQYSMLLTSLTTGKTIKVSGKNDCLRWGDGEDVQMLHMFQ